MALTLKALARLATRRALAVMADQARATIADWRALNADLTRHYQHRKEDA